VNRREFMGGGAPPLFNRIRNQFIPDAIKRLLGLTAEMGTPQLAPELQFSIDIFQRDEFWVLLGGSLMGARQVGQAAAPGFNGIHAIVNPAGSAELAIVDYLRLENNAGGTRTAIIAMGRGQLTTPSTTTWVSTDQRRVASGPTQFFPPTRVQLQSSNAAAFSGSTDLARYGMIVGFAVEAITPDKAVLVAPGFMLQILTSNVNEINVDVSCVRIRTRPLQGTELAVQ
jgi:hypothetical protein